MHPAKKMIFLSGSKKFVNSKSLIFDGVNERFFLNSIIYDIIQPLVSGAGKKFSFVFRIKKLASPAVFHYLFSNSGTNRQIEVDWNTGNNLQFLAFSSNDNYTYWQTTAAFNSTATGYTIIVTYDATLAITDRVTINVNGVDAARSTTNVGTGLNQIAAVPGQTLTIMSNGANNPTNAYFAEMMFFSKVLTATEKTLIYNGGACLNPVGLIPGLEIWLPAENAMHNGTDFILNEGQGNGTATSVNMEANDLVNVTAPNY